MESMYGGSDGFCGLKGGRGGLEGGGERAQSYLVKNQHWTQLT